MIGRAKERIFFTRLIKLKNFIKLTMKKEKKNIKIRSENGDYVTNLKEKNN